MSTRSLTLTLLLAGGLTATLAACQTAQPAPAPAAQAAQAAEPVGDKPDPSVLVGAITREQVEAAVPDWVQTQVESKPDAAAAQGLASVEPGAEVTVFLGTWCGDSRREVSRLWRAIDDVGGTVPFQVRYIGVDMEKKEPAGPVTESKIEFVPTLIVRRGGQEVGRIVETSPNGVEADLLALLTGKAKGALSASQPVSP